MFLSWTFVVTWFEWDAGTGVRSTSFVVPHAFVPDPNVGPQDAGKPMVCRVCERPYRDEVHGYSGVAD